MRSLTSRLRLHNHRFYSVSSDRSDCSDTQKKLDSEVSEALIERVDDVYYMNEDECNDFSRHIKRQSIKDQHKILTEITRKFEKDKKFFLTREAATIAITLGVCVATQSIVIPICGGCVMTVIYAYESECISSRYRFLQDDIINSIDVKHNNQKKHD